jgi:hypothetical protein
MATAFTEDDRARGLLGRSIISRDGELPEQRQLFTVSPDVAAGAVSGTYKNDQKFVQAIKASFKAAVDKNCTADAKALIGRADESNISVEWQSMLEATDPQRSYLAGTVLCTADGKVDPSYKSMGVIAAVFKTKVTFTASQTGGVDVGANASCSSGDTSGSASISITASAEGRTEIKSEGWNFVKLETLETACKLWHDNQPHAATPDEADRFRQVASAYSQALLASFQCHWMYGGVRILDAICPSGQCADAEHALRTIYRSDVGSIVDAHRQAVCDGIKDTLTSLGTPPDAVSGVCEDPALLAWVLRHGGDRFEDVTDQDAVSAQIDLLSAILDTPRVRRPVAGAWAKLPQARDQFRTAMQAWADLRASCGTGGCTFALVSTSGNPVDLSSRYSWDAVRNTLFDAWLYTFSAKSDEVPEFRAGCANAVMALEDNRWRYKNDTSDCPDGASRCLEFGAPEHVDAASDWFARQVVR